MVLALLTVSMRKFIVTFVTLLGEVRLRDSVGTRTDLRLHPRGEVADLLVDPQPADLDIGLEPPRAHIVVRLPVLGDAAGKASTGRISISAG